MLVAPRLGCRLWLQRDGVSEGLELGDEALRGFGGVAALEVVAAEVVVDLARGEHVPVGDHDRVFDRAECAAVSEARLEAPVLSAEIGVPAANRAERGFFERDPEPLTAFAGPPGASFAGRLVIARAAPRPAREMPS